MRCHSFFLLSIFAPKRFEEKCVLFIRAKNLMNFLLDLKYFSGYELFVWFRVRAAFRGSETSVVSVGQKKKAQILAIRADRM